MLRKFNYTGRQRIPHSAVSIRLTKPNGRAISFEADFDLSGLKLPGHAQVYIEAYHRASYMRFPFGCVSDKTIPDDRELRDIEGGGTAALFRVKVIDETAKKGQVLAEADRISPFDDDDDQSGRRSILPVALSDALGDQLWRIGFDSGDGRPLLELNSGVEGIAQIAKTDDIFLALVHPAVIRIVLHQILRGANHIESTDLPEGDWRDQWLKFAMSLPNVIAPPIPSDTEFNDDAMEQSQLEWIDDVVGAFCMQRATLERFNRVLDRRGD